MDGAAKAGQSIKAAISRHFRFQILQLVERKAALPFSAPSGFAPTDPDQRPPIDPARAAD
jgi:hypothetical protein